MAANRAGKAGRAGAPGRFPLEHDLRRSVLDTREHGARGPSERGGASVAGGGGGSRGLKDVASTSGRGGARPRQGYGGSAVARVSSRRAEAEGPAASGKKKARTPAAPAAMPRLSHVDRRGRVKMVDVGDKPVTTREAIARGTITMSREALRLIRRGAVKKGDPLQTARLAGILAAKQTSALIPLCHPLPLSGVDVELTPTSRGYEIEARVRTTAQTGVEMEALTAVAIAALTIYDMIKAVDKSMVIGDVRLIYKSGGRSGTYRRP
jgi:cyclic pyranopterin monophosphate synthase